MKKYYLNQQQLNKYFPVRDTILTRNKEEILENLSRKLSLSKEMVGRFFNASHIKEVMINEQPLYCLKKKNKDTWGSYFSEQFKEKFSNLSWESLKEELEKEHIGVINTPKNITELFNSSEILHSISEIKEKIVQPIHSLTPTIKDALLTSLFKNISFYEEQKRAIKEGVNAWLLNRHAFLFLGEMGVGKTMCTTAMVEVSKHLRNTPQAQTLVVAPDHLLTKWRDEILWVSPRTQVEILDQKKLENLWENNQMLPQAEYFIVPQSVLAVEVEKSYKSMLILEALFKPSFKQQITYAIWDESHLLSRPLFSSKLQKLAKLAKYNVLATGTSIAGSVADLFPKAHAFFPKDAIRPKSERIQFMVSERVKWISACEKAFVAKFGAYSINANGRNKQQLPGYKAEIGVSSEFITEFILPNSIFLTTEQVWEDKVENLIFPPLLVEMTEAQKLAMTSLDLVAKNAAENDNKRIFGRYLKVANEYLDNPNVKDITFKEELLWSPVPFQLVYKFDETLLPKEEKLIDVCTMEKSQDRPVVVFVKHLDRLKNRLIEVLTHAGFKVGSLPDSVKAVDRQDYINKKLLNEKCDIMLINPAKVATGTDLLSAPTVLFFNTGFSYFEVGQSERRSYRIGQKRQTRVYYLGYKGEGHFSVQEQVLRMIAEKKRAMESIQGNIDEEGLSSLLGKNQSSILNQLVDNMNGHIESEEDQTVDSKVQYYMDHFGEQLELEDAGRPSLDEHLNFVWPEKTGTETKRTRVLFSEARFVKFRKSSTKEESKEINLASEIFSFDESGEMSLFDLLQPA